MTSVFEFPPTGGPAGNAVVCAIPKRREEAYVAGIFRPPTVSRAPMAYVFNNE